MSNPSLYASFRNDLQEISFLKNSVASLDALTARYGDVHTQLAEDVLSIAHALGWDTQEVFARYVLDYVKEQIQFEKHGEYGHSDFDKIKAEILDNAEVMKEMYFPGLFLAYPTTAILFHKYVFFKDHFLPHLNENMYGAEVGYGDGFYLWVILNHLPGLQLAGFDISPHAREFAEELLTVAGIAKDRFTLEVANVFEGLPLDDASLDWAVLAEIIEHLPNPADAIIEVSRKLKPGGWLYVATMIDCNHMDHISNFESPEAVAALLTDNGFEVEDRLVYRVTDDIPDSTDRAVSVAFTARKR